MIFMIYLHCEAPFQDHHPHKPCLHDNELLLDHNYNYTSTEATTTPCCFRPTIYRPLPPNPDTHTQTVEHFLHITVLMCLTAACKNPSNLSKSRTGCKPKRRPTHTPCLPHKRDKDSELKPPTPSLPFFSRWWGSLCTSVCLCAC